MWDPNSNILGTAEKNRMQYAHITNGGRSLVRRVHDATRREEKTEVGQWKDGETHWC